MGGNLVCTRDRSAGKPGGKKPGGKNVLLPAAGWSRRFDEALRDENTGRRGPTMLVTLSEDPLDATSGNGAANQVTGCCACGRGLCICAAASSLACCLPSEEDASPGKPVTICA